MTRQRFSVCFEDFNRAAASSTVNNTSSVIAISFPALSVQTRTNAQRRTKKCIVSKRLHLKRESENRRDFSKLAQSVSWRCLCLPQISRHRPPYLQIPLNTPSPQSADKANGQPGKSVEFRQLKISGEYLSREKRPDRMVCTRSNVRRLA